MKTLAILSERLHRISSGSMLAVSAALLAAVLVLLKVIDTPFGVLRIKKLSGGVKILDMQGHYGADQAYATLESLGAAGRQAYVKFLVFGDVLLPLSYGLFLAVALSLGIRGMLAGRTHGITLLNLMPLLAVVLDLLENLAILALLAAFPDRRDGLAALAGIITAAKRATLMTSLWGGLAALSGWGLLAALRRVRGKTPHE